MNLTLGELKPGAYREVTAEEEAELMKLLADSKNETVIDEAAIREREQIQRMLRQQQRGKYGR